MSSTILTTREVADLLKISERTVRDLCVRGEIRASRVGQQWRVRSDDVDAYLRANSNQPQNVVAIGGAAR